MILSLVVKQVILRNVFPLITPKSQIFKKEAHRLQLPSAKPAPKYLLIGEEE